MEECNKAAVLEVLGPQNLKNADKLDLHGLLVAEAVDATKQFVISNIGKKKTLEIITGAGHHSANRHAAIKPAITDLCKAEKWKLEPEPNNEGAFILNVPSK